MISKMLSVTWKHAEVKSPHLERPVPVLIARNIPYTSNANRLQNLNIYLPYTNETSALIDQPVTSFPPLTVQSSLPQIQVHIHGGAWRDPNLQSTSIEATVSHTFTALKPNLVPAVTAIASLNYTVSPFPTHPTEPYDPVINNHSDPAREALHPQHVHDVLDGFVLLRSLGLQDNSYILSGHSAGACLAFQSILHDASYWDYNGPNPPCPAAVVGMNGLYDLPDLVHNLGASHEHLKDVYADLQGIAFSMDEKVWTAASPTTFDAEELSRRVDGGQVPKLFMIDQSTEDQLVPVNQANKLEGLLKTVDGLEVVRGKRCTGVHAAPWEQGYMIWENVQDVLNLLSQKK